MLITSVKNNTQFYQDFGWILLPLQWQNYAAAWQEISQYILNSTIVRPASATVAILQILSTWNDYIWPSVTLYSNAVFTIPIGLVAFETHHTTDWGPLMASYTLAAVPLVVLFALTTRTFIAGLTQ